MIKVGIFESEKGWGQKLLDVKHFTIQKFAEKYVKEFNAKNNEERTPDYYTYARIIDYVNVVAEQ